MSRIIYYANSLVTSKQLSQSQIFATEELGLLTQAVVGTAIGASGLPCTPSSGLSVDIGDGAIFAVAPIDKNAFGVLPANSNTVVKIATHFTPTNFQLFSPDTMGHSINYLIEGNFLEIDDQPEVVEYFNPNNPSEPIYGLGPDHRPQYTIRRTLVSLNLLTGNSAITGTQITPSATSGWNPLWVITISAGQSFVDPDNIIKAPDSNFIEGIYDKFATLDSKIANAYSYIKTVNDVFVNSTTTSATQINDLYSKYNNSVAQIYELNQTFANTNTAVATEISNMTSKIDNNTATIYQLSQTVVNSQTATAIQINQLSSQLLDNFIKSDIYQINQTIASLESTTALQINTLNSKFDSTEASISQLNQTVANTNTALATQVSSLNSKIAGANAAISQLSQTIAEPNLAIALQVDNLTSEVANANARINILSQTIVNANSATAQTIDTLNSKINTNNSNVYASINELARTVANTNTATTIRIDSLNSELSTANASINQLSQTVSTENTATAQELDSLRSNVGNISAKVDILASTSTANGISTSTYGIRLDADGVITGLQTFAGSNGISTFDIYASTFRLTDPNNPTLKYTPLLFKDGILRLGNTIVDGTLIVNGSVVTNTLANNSVSNLVVSTGSEVVGPAPPEVPVVYNPAVDNSIVIDTTIDWSGYDFDFTNVNFGYASSAPMFLADEPLSTSLDGTDVPIKFGAGSSSNVGLTLLSHNIVLKYPARVIIQGYGYANDGGGRSANSHNSSIEIRVLQQGGIETTVAANQVKGVPWAVSQALTVMGAIQLPAGTHYISLIGSTANNDYFSQKLLMSHWLYK